MTPSGSAVERAARRAAGLLLAAAVAVAVAAVVVAGCGVRPQSAPVPLTGAPLPPAVVPSVVQQPDPSGAPPAPAVPSPNATTGPTES